MVLGLSNTCFCFVLQHHMSFLIGCFWSMSTKHVLKKPHDRNRPIKEWGLIDSKSGLFNHNIDFNSPSWFSRLAYTCVQYLVSIESSFNICLVGVVFLTHLKCDFFLYSSITLVFSFMLNKSCSTFQLFWQKNKFDGCLTIFFLFIAWSTKVSTEDIRGWFSTWAR